MSALVVTALAALCVVMAAADSDPFGASPFLLKAMVWDPQRFSLTSLRFNSFAVLPKWVDHLLGNRAVFWKMNGEGQDKKLLNTLEEGRQAVMDAAEMKSSAFSPQCSFELLGMVRVDSTAPFMGNEKHKKPAVGRGSLSVAATQWDCYYRATYDNWRLSEDWSPAPNFWPVFVYCAPPRVNASQCDAVRDELVTHGEAAAELQLQTLSDRWTVPFHLVRNDFASEADRLSDMAVCTSLPYVSRIEHKRDSVGAIFFEFVRYHTRLGIHVVVYDATGRQRRHLVDSAYARSQLAGDGAAGAPSPLLLTYHSHSILGALDPALLNTTYDNELADSASISKLDDDHSLSLTHCRFDVQARWGTRFVLNIDFDEFLLCPSAPLTARGQAHAVHRLAKVAHSRGLDALHLPQRVAQNRTAAGAQACVAQQVLAAAQGSSVRRPSVLDCFAAHKHSAGDLHKAMHLTAACPFNTDHDACSSGSGLDWADYDCICNLHIPAQCSLLHLAIRQAEQVSRGDDDAQMRRDACELGAIVNSLVAPSKPTIHMPDF